MEVHWHKVRHVDAGDDSDELDRSRREAIIDRALLLLGAWQATKHQLLLGIRQVWKSSYCTLEVVASFSGIPDLRTYVRVHQHLGEVAIRKISRQVLKGARAWRLPLPLTIWSPL